MGDGVAFTRLLEVTPTRRYGIEIDANRAEQARSLGIDRERADRLAKPGSETDSLPWRKLRRHLSSSCGKVPSTHPEHRCRTENVGRRGTMTAAAVPEDGFEA